ncbi:hypothetical protein EON83_00140 [bacterium]|nr:MAG: hypothetical protein EON83_00140 [bacterium]
MPLILWINEIFPEAQAPYELKEVYERLHLYWSDDVSESGVYRALEWLRDQEGTAALVAPLNPKGTPRLYTCEGARRIARRAVAGKYPAHFYARNGAITSPPKDLFEALELLANFMHPKRDSTANTT